MKSFFLFFFFVLFLNIFMPTLLCPFPKTDFPGTTCYTTVQHTVFGLNLSENKIKAKQYNDLLLST